MRKQLLVIDDDPLFIDFVKEVLAVEDIDVVSSPNGKAALPLLEHDLPSFVVCDFEMPEMNGLQFHTRFSGDPRTRDIPFFFMTGSPDRVLLDYAKEHGIRVFYKSSLVQELQRLLAYLR